MHTKGLSLLLVALLTPAWLFAQGQVYFSNNQTDFATPADRRVYIGPQLLVGTDWRAQLYVGTAPDNLQPLNNTPASFRPADTTAPGTWIGGMRTIPVPSGTPVYLQVKVWNINYGASFEDSAMVGGPSAASAAFTYTPPPNGSALTAFYMENLSAFASLATPEPNTLTLILVGSLGWLIQRGALRRKA